jgi:molybdopterin-containing oxidoreductase family iron-sulfur binding subunit
VGEDGRVGKNAAGLLQLSEGLLRNAGLVVAVAKTGKRHLLASTQDFHSLSVPENLALPGWEPRPVVQETTWEQFQKNPDAGSIGHGPAQEDLWPRDHTFPGHRWAMTVDLSACTGCSA